MKRKISKIWSIGLTLMLAVSLLLVAAPGTLSAAEPVINEWDEFAYPDPGADGDWFWDPTIGRVGEITEAINGDLYVHAVICGVDEILKSTDGGHTWELTKYSDPDDGVVGGWVIDMVCSSIDEDILYVTDGFYFYKTDNGGDEWDYVAKASLEVALGGEWGCELACCDIRPITSIDVGYNDDDDPFVFIGTREHCSQAHPDGPTCVPGSVYYITEAGYPAAWTDLKLSCIGDYDALAVGCPPDFADSKKTFAVVTDGSETHVVSTTGTTCDWTEFAELVWDCVPANSFGSLFASRIGFPDDWEDTETLFVVDRDTCVECEEVETDIREGCGGDVYAVSEDESIDRNVRPGTGGCEGDATDIISLDVMGDTDEASIIAGVFCDPDPTDTSVTGTTVYYSTDGGWEWDPSVKHPTGDWLTYVIWYGDSALAATAGCEAAVSLSCVSEEEDAEEVGMSWNQISLIATDITCVLDIDHSPGYITDSETLFMVTESDGWCYSTSLFRYDGTYWDRVFCSTTYEGDFISDDEQIRVVMVSPDFLDTEAVFVANYDFDIFRSLDAGCSWDRLGYPCDEIDLLSWAVLDEDTIYVGGEDGVVYLTERHGSRSWDECLVADADDDTEAGDIRYFAFDITDGAMTILVGDGPDGVGTGSQVFLCEVDPDKDWEDQEWHLVGDCQDVLETYFPTSVVFDPGYAVTDDEGENMIYAAAGEVIARCIIDWDEDWADQEWTKIGGYEGSEYWGIKVVGDTALYVGDRAYGGVDRSLNPTEEDEDDIEWNWAIAGLEAYTRGLRTLTAGENGCPDSNVLWTIGTIGEDGDCDEVWFYEDTLAIGGIEDFAVQSMLIDFDRRPNQDEIVIGKAVFSLPEGASYDLDVDDVTITVDDVLITISAGSFIRAGNKETYVFTSTEGVEPKVHMKLDFNKGEWSLKVSEIDASAIDNHNGVDLTFAIGSLSAREKLDMWVERLSHTAEY